MDLDTRRNATTSRTFMRGSLETSLVGSGARRLPTTGAVGLLIPIIFTSCSERFSDVFITNSRRFQPAPAAEDLEQPGARALRPLRHEDDAPPVVRVRGRRDQQLEVESPPAGRGAEVPEIDLAGAGRPLELEAPPFSPPAAYKRQSVVITTNLEFSRWGSVLGDDQVVAAVIDRIVHHGRLVQFRDESYRVRHVLMREG